jgi:threonine aldolase
MKDIAELVDVFYIGGTKNGALLGEALVICKQELREDFRYLIKQRGAMMAKGFVIGLQFEALFEQGLYYELGTHANRMAEKIAQALSDKGISFYAPFYSNQIFPILSDEIIDKMAERFGFQVQERVDDKHCVIRLVTSWASSQSNVDSMIEFIQEI